MKYENANFKVENPKRCSLYHAQKKTGKEDRGSTRSSLRFGGAFGNHARIRKLSKFTFVSKLYHISDLQLFYTCTTNDRIEKYEYSY